MESCLILSLLSDDILSRILDRLLDDSDKKSFRTTCKSFHRVESMNRTRIKFYRPEFIPRLLKNYTCTDTIDFSACPRIHDGSVSVLLSDVTCLGWARRLRKVVLSRTTSLRFTGLEMLVSSCPRLETVDVSHCYQFGDREAAALSRAAELREVKLDKCLRLTDVGLAKIAIRCGNLEKVSLKWCLEITDLGIDLLTKKCARLRHLSVSYLKISNESLRSISSLTKLEVLLMVGCGFVADEGLHFIGNGCPSLQVLDVSRCEHVSSAGLISVTRGCKGLQKLNAGYYFLELSTTVFQSFKDLKNLKTIRVDGVRVNNSFFQIISTNCLFLVEVGLSKCEGVDDAGVMQLAYGHPGLKILDLTCCNDLTDMVMSAIAQSCSKLVCLKLESCSLLTEKSFSFIGSSCVLLEELDLTECCVNDKGLEYLSKCVELQCLRLGICTDISGTGLSYIASNCKNLRELDLYRCLNVGDDGLGFIASGCKKIRNLNLCYCTKITDIGMTYLSQLEELSDLEMRSLFKVTSVGLTALASGCRKLSELDIKHCGNISDAGFWSLGYYSWNLQQVFSLFCTEKVVATATPSKPSGEWCASWIFSTGHELLVSTDMAFDLKTNNSSIDSEIKLLNGRHLHYQNEQNKDDEDRFVTLVRVSDDHPSGRATGLINWKLSAMEFLPEEDAAFVLLLGTTILRSVTEMRKEDVGSLLIRRRLKEANHGDRDWGSVMVVEESLRSVYVKPWHWNAEAVMARQGVEYVAKSYSVEECGDDLYKQALFGN